MSSAGSYSFIASADQVLGANFTLIPNHPLIANPGPDQTVRVRQIVTLSGSGSSDADGDPLTHRWTILTTPARGKAKLNGATSVNPTFAPDKVGSYVVSLVVNDGKVDSVSDQVTITETKKQGSIQSPIPVAALYGGGEVRGRKAGGYRLRGTSSRVSAGTA